MLVEVFRVWRGVGWNGMEWTDGWGNLLVKEIRYFGS